MIKRLTGLTESLGGCINLVVNNFLMTGLNTNAKIGLNAPNKPLLNILITLA